MTTSILRQDPSGLTLYESEREFPIKPIIETSECVGEPIQFLRAEHQEDVTQWFADARKFPVAEESKLSFYKLHLDTNKTIDLTKGFKLPEGCYELMHPFNDVWEAFFKQPAPPPVNEADLWDEVCKILLLNTPVVFGLTEVKKRFSITRKPQP